MAIFHGKMMINHWKNWGYTTFSKPKPYSKPFFTPYSRFVKSFATPPGVDSLPGILHLNSNHWIPIYANTGNHNIYIYTYLYLICISIYLYLSIKIYLYIIYHIIFPNTIFPNSSVNYLPVVIDINPLKHTDSNPLN